MSSGNIFKIKVLEPSFCHARPQTSNMISNPNSAFGYNDHCDFLIHKIQNGRPLTNQVQNKVSRSKNKQISTIQSYKSASVCHSHRVGRKELPVESQNTKEKKLERPQSAMIKKSRKRSWQTYNTKVPVFKQDDILFKKDQNFSQQLEECVAFLKKKGIFVRIVKDRDDLEWEPISNEYIVKIYGRAEICNKMYFLTQNLGKSSIRNTLDSFGPYKESLVKKQIRSLICGVIHCHYRGIIHNRINPDTIFMNQEGNLLIDLAKLSQKMPSEVEKKAYFHYFSPELLNKQVVAESCDVWAIGCLTLEMLCGKIANSVYHPYNQQWEGSPSSKNSGLKKLREECKKYGNQEAQKANQQVYQRVQEGISKSARVFIKACLKLNEKARPELSTLIGHDFLRI